MSGPRWKLAPPLLGLAGLLGLLYGPATAAGATTTFTTSTWHHRYDVYLGTVELLRPGASVPYRTETVFESQIRFDQQAVEYVGAALAPDQRFSAGVATLAPDGGPWITGAVRPGWWEKPNGSAEGQPLFDGAGRFTAAMSPQSLLTTGETATCSDSGSGRPFWRTMKGARPESCPT